jgi:metal-responsive CopG/Arc/MetJ family transcriptional regulator
MRKKSYTRPLGVVLDDDLFDQLVELTDRKEISKSEFIRNLIKDYFQKRSKTEGNLVFQKKGGKQHE